MNEFHIVEVDDRKWMDFVSRSFRYDFYQTQSYQLLEKNDRPVLCVLTFDDDFLALPLIIRTIPDSDFYDCTSVYGYCGPVSNLDFAIIPRQQFEKFKEQLDLFFKDNGIISAFSRLNPLISTGLFFNNFGVVENINSTVAIDLRLPVEEQKRQYRKSTKSELNQLRKKGYEVIEAGNDDDIDAFIDIYYETMRRVNAGCNYFFEREYFYNFLHSDCFKSVLLLAKKDGKIAAGAIFTATDKIMQYHLAGTSIDYIKETPMKLILDEARLLGNSLRMEFLHLGGGVGGSDEDSLFRFKSGFSDTRFIFKVWKYIVDHKEYEKLVDKKNKGKEKNTFFPLYRA